MNKLKLILGFAFLLGIFACNELADDEFKIVLTGGEHLPVDSKIYIYIPSRSADGATHIKTLAEGVFVEGRFEHKGIVEEPCGVVINIAPGTDKYPYKRINMVLEPGETDIAFGEHHTFTLKGGRLNDLIVNSWNDDPAYQKAFLDWEVLSYKDRGGQKATKEDMTEIRQVMRVMDEKRHEAMTVAFEKATDYEKLFFYQAMYSPKKDFYEFLDYWQRLATPFTDKLEGKLVFNSMKTARESAETRKTVADGKIIKDFTAQNAEGTTFHLREVLARNKYVLVEFWASWCGPCRGEIPHMKKAYQKFHKKGFEIVSFTLDDKKVAWEKASKEEQLPWIDTGDLKGFVSPVAKMYGVNAIPANYLVESSTGKIIASNLRQHKLDDKLKELLGKKTP